MDRANRKKIIQVIVMFITFILFSVMFFNTPGTGDVSIWKGWIDYAKDNGLKVGYSMQHDMYPPFALIIQIILANSCKGLSNFVILRMVNIFFLILSTIIIFILYKNMQVTVLSFIALLLSTSLGYLDIEMVPFIILSFFFLSKGKVVCSSVSFTILCLIKFQPLIVLPYMLTYFIRFWDWERKCIKIEFNRKELLLIFISPIMLGGSVLLFYRKAFIKALYNALFTSGSSMSPNGLNFGWILQYIFEVRYPEIYGPLDNGKICIIWNTAQNHLSFKYIFFGILGISFFIALSKGKDNYKNILKCAIAGYTGYYLFNSGVHENHLFLAMILMILLYLEESKQRNFYRMILYIVAFNINLLILYGLSGHGMGFDRAIEARVDPTLYIAIYNVIVFSVIIFELISEVIAEDVAKIDARIN